MPGATLTVATEEGDAVQMAEFVRFCVFPSANVPIALKRTLVCWAMVVLAGVICTDISGDGSTTKPAVPLIEPCCAVMVEVPADSPVACPPLVIVATFVAEELHCTAFVMARVLPSLYVPVAHRTTWMPGRVRL